MISNKILTTLNKTLAELGVGDVVVVLEHPAQEIHGDYATNVAMILAKKLNKDPMKIAKKIVKKLSKIQEVAKIEVAKPGFINFFLDIKWLVKNTLKEILTKKDKYGDTDIGKGRKVIVEHTSVNPNKAMHVGNLRNAILGDTLARLLKKCGYQVEIQNYIDDTGAQVADTTTALLYLGKKQPKDQPFDEFCWDIYAQICQFYETKPELQEEKKEVIQAIEEGSNEIADLAKEISDKIVQCHLEQMAKFGIFYDLLVYESDLLKSGFWEQAFKQLKKCPNFVYKTSGKQKGCWVLKYKGSGGGDKIFVRSDGTTVYTAKDTAYHLWKFGLLKKDFLYNKWPQKIDSKIVWRTDQQKGRTKKGFGKATKIINVIDERQSHPQKMVKLALKSLGFEKQSKNYHHLAYGVVYLSPKTAKKLGVDISDQKEFYAMAGRKGIGVKVSDLLKLLVQKIESERGAKETSDKNRVASSLDVAVGAIRHYMLKYNYKSAVTFDYEQALNLYGNTGPYLQYSHARASGILRKAGKFNPQFEKGKSLNSLEGKLIKLLSFWPEIIEEAGKNLMVSQIAEYAFKLSSQFHSFYEENPVLKAKEKVKNFRLTLVLAYKIIIADVLFVLGIFAPERM